MFDSLFNSPPSKGYLHRAGDQAAGGKQPEAGRRRARGELRGVDGRREQRGRELQLHERAQRLGDFRCFSSLALSPFFARREELSDRKREGLKKRKKRPFFETLRAPDVHCWKWVSLSVSARKEFESKSTNPA